MNFLMNISRLLTTNLEDVGAEVNNILNTWIGPLFTVLGGVGAIYIIVLAIQYIKSENDSKRAEAKSRIINCAIGVVALLVLGAVCLTVNWAEFVQIFGYAKSESLIGLL